MKDKLGDKARLEHILDAILEIENYIREVSKDDFYDTSMIKFATLKQLEIIGEASNHISEEFKNRFSNLNWRVLIAFRNKIVHEYFGINFELIWEIIKSDLPQIKSGVLNIFDQLNNES